MANITSLANITELTCDHCAQLFAQFPNATRCDELLFASPNATLTEEYATKRHGGKFGWFQCLLLFTFPFCVASVAFYLRAFLKAPKKGRGAFKLFDKLIFSAHFGILGLDFCAISAAFGGFDRAFYVVGNPELLKEDYCQMNSAVTGYGEFLSFFLAFSVSVLSSSIAMSAINLYVDFVCSNATKKKLKNVLPKAFVTYIAVGGVAWPLAGHFSAPHGPLGAYPGIRCVEFGISEDYATNDKCYVRLIQFYIMLLVNAMLTILPVVVVVKTLKAHAKKMSGKTGTAKPTKAEETGGKKKKKKEKGGLDAASSKMVKFAACVGVLELGAFVVRLGSSLTPNAEKEGVVGIPELVCIVAPLAGYFLFGYTKAPWGSTFFPWQSAKVGSSSGSSSKGTSVTSSGESGGSSAGE